MRWLKWTGIAAALLLIFCCFQEWVFIRSKSLSISGIDAAGTDFGKPGYLHFILTAFFIVFTLIPKVWAKRANLLVSALNLAWALRNYFFISACMGGECPEKQPPIFLLLVATIVMLISALFPDIYLNTNEKK
ncbi:MAG: hypothetical protein ABI480_13195 [Chitinophagaceae bacterium]